MSKMTGSNNTGNNSQDRNNNQSALVGSNMNIADQMNSSLRSRSGLKSNLDNISASVMGSDHSSLGHSASPEAMPQIPMLNYEHFVPNLQ